MKHFADPRTINRAGIGFDRILNVLETLTADAGGNFPPYDIERVDTDGFRLTLALAGYGEEEIALEVEDGVLTVKGTKAEETGQREFLHRGIAARSFERRFRLADHIEVKSAAMANGLLVIDLLREVPEAKKPRRIEIGKKAADAEPATD